MGQVKRPGGVTLVAVLTWISGLLDIIGGTLLLFQTSVAATAEAFGGASGLITSAIVSILIGAIVIVVANGLLRGSAVSRMVITVIEVLSIVARSSSPSRTRPRDRRVFLGGDRRDRHRAALDRPGERLLPRLTRLSNVRLVERPPCRTSNACGCLVCRHCTAGVDARPGGIVAGRPSVSAPAGPVVA